EAEPEVTLRVTATDAAGLTHEETFKLTVEDVNEAPTAVDDTARTVANTAVDVDVLANAEDPASRPLSLVAVAEPKNGTAAIVDDRAVYEPAYGFVGRDRFAYTVANDRGLEDEAVLTVEVAGDGEPFADGTFFADGTGWLDSAA
ncbi:MAG: Ig-like domain-containing protein, partial [Alphaproteobacteria bacterium]